MIKNHIRKVEVIFTDFKGKGKMINLSWKAVIREDGRQHNIIRLFVLCGSAGGGGPPRRAFTRATPSD